MPSDESSTQGRNAIDRTVLEAYEDILNEALLERFVTLLKWLRQGEFPEVDRSSDGTD